MSQIGIGQTAADFEAQAVVNGEIKPFKFSDYRGKYCVFFWWPLDFTFVCPTEIIAFSEAAKRFREIGCEVVGASCDSEFTHLAWVNTPREKGGLGFMDIPIVADFSKEIAKQYGVLLPGGVPARATFVIDGKGTIRSVVCNDPPVGRNVEEILRLVQAFQYTDVHGEVCPANWKPGAQTMKADPEKSLEYFASAASSKQTEEAGDIADVASTEDFQSAISGTTPVVVQFSAAWCGKCKALSPHIVRMSKENTGVKFLRVDVEKLHELADTSGVTALPTIQVYKNGNLLSAYTGSSADEVAKLVQSAGSA